MWRIVSHAQVKEWHLRFEEDTASHHLFSDARPKTLFSWELQVDTENTVLYGGYIHKRLIAGMWFHDITREPDRSDMWLGGWIDPEFRSQVKIKTLWDYTHEQLGENVAIHAACRIENTRAQYITEQGLGFTRVGSYPDFAPFEGVLRGCILFTSREENISRLWMSAQRRSSLYKNLTK